MQVSFRQFAFSRLNMRTDTSLMGEGEYPFLLNGRIRTSVVSPVKSPIEIGLPDVGNIQGIYGIANYLILFIGGKAYAADVNYSSSIFYPIKDFQMSPEAPVIYAVAVPDSYVNYERRLEGQSVSNPITFGPNKTNHTPSVLVCQDGINQPRLILPTGQAVISKTFSEWTLEERQYVPIGLQMLFFNGKLYIVSPDSKRIYHSVTGRPLDFVIVVDKDGNKIEGQDAEATAWSVNYEKITAIKELSTTKEEFMVCTERSSYLIKPKYDTLFCGEPLFSTQYLFSTGAKNQFSVVDILGDTVFVDFSGIKSFNSVLQTSTEGRNSPFSAILSRLFVGIGQDNPCAINYDNYALFSIKTIYGNLIAVFDTITNSFVSLDKYSIEGNIRQFAEIVSSTDRELFFSTDSNKLYKAFAGKPEKVSIYLGDFSPKDTIFEQVLQTIKLVFLSVKESGTISVIPFYDGIKGTEIKKDLLVQTTNEITELPYLDTGGDSVKTVFYTITDARQAYKVGVLVSWKFQADLSMIQTISSLTSVSSSFEQLSQEFRHFKSNLPVLISMEPEEGPPGTLITLHGSNFIGVKKIWFNDQPAVFTIQDEKIILLVGPSQSGLYQIKLETDTGVIYNEKPYKCL